MKNAICYLAVTHVISEFNIFNTFYTAAYNEIKADDESP